MYIVHIVVTCDSRANKIHTKIGILINSRTENNAVERFPQFVRKKVSWVQQFLFDMRVSYRLQAPSKLNLKIIAKSVKYI